ncbi:hypothetical protein JHK82_042928 [Glycine max]|nr:hypothetical protein JHK82_042928 [Glycine max]
MQKNEGFAESQGNEFIPAGFPVGPWNDSAIMSDNVTGLKRFRDEDVKPFSGGLNAPESQNETGGQQPSSSALAHQLSLPNTSAEMAAIEKFLQLSDSVPCKIRAKRGCATHPRSIAERAREVVMDDDVLNMPNWGYYEPFRGGHLGLQLMPGITERDTKAFLPGREPAMLMDKSTNGLNPNSVLSWLERWSASHFWKPVPQPKKIGDTKSQRKHGNISVGDTHVSKSKRINRKLPTASFDSENPQSELEKIKRNLRKVYNPVVENAVPSEVESEMPKDHLEKVTVTSCLAVSEQEVISSNEKIKKEAILTVSSVPDIETTPRLSVSKEVSDTPSSYQVTVESKPLTEITTKDKNISVSDEVKNEPIDLPEPICKDENSHLTNGDLSHKEDQIGSENQKPNQKASIVAKQERAENGIQNSPTLPSYMAATESAKAKLRAQGSPRFGQDGSERNNHTRRHSLPSSTNSKINSPSPRTQRPVQSGGKGGHRSDRTVSSSRDGNETSGAPNLQIIQPPDSSSDEKVDRVEEVVVKKEGGQSKKRQTKDNGNAPVQRAKPPKKTMELVINGIRDNHVVWHQHLCR